MPLNQLALTTTNGVVGRSFSSAVTGITAGSTVELLSYAGAPGFSYANGRVSAQSLQWEQNAVVLRETLAGETRDSSLVVTADRTTLGPGGLSSAISAVGLTPNAATIFDVLGDSRFDLEDVSPDPLIQRKSASSIISQLQYRPSFNNRLRRNVKGAKAGYTSAEFLQIFLPAILASGSPIVFMMGMLNDSGAGATAQQAYYGWQMGFAGVSGTAGDSTGIGGIAGAIAKITAQGRRVVIFTDYPPDTCAAARFAELMAGNAIAQDIASKNRLVTLVDMANIMMNKTTTPTLSGGNYTNLLDTSLCKIESTIQHPNMAGAMRIAAEVDAAISQFVPPAPPARVSSRADGPLTNLGAGAAGVTNVLWNSLFMETGAGPAYMGAPAAVGSVTGTPPPGYRLTAGANASVTVSTVAGPFGNDLQLAITTTGSGSVTLQQDVNAAGKTDQNVSLRGVPIRGSIEVEVAAGSAALVGVQANYSSDGTGAILFGSNEVDQGTPGAGPTTAYTQVLVSPVLTVPANAGVVSTAVRMIFNGAGSATIRLRRHELRRLLSAA